MICEVNGVALCNKPVKKKKTLTQIFHLKLYASQYLLLYCLTYTKLEWKKSSMSSMTGNLNIRPYPSMTVQSKTTAEAAAAYDFRITPTACIKYL